MAEIIQWPRANETADRPIDHNVENLRKARASFLTAWLAHCLARPEEVRIASELRATLDAMTALAATARLPDHNQAAAIFEAYYRGLIPADLAVRDGR
jgi:hypothetical protein